MHSHILGRHVTNSPVRIPVASGSSNHNVAPRGPGVHNKPPQVCAHAEYTAGVSGFPDQYTDNDHSFTAGQDFRLAEGSIRIVETQSSSNQVFRTVRRETCGNQTSSLYSSTTLPSTAESEGRHHSCSSRADSPFTGGLQGLEMVISQLPVHCSSPLLRLEASTVITSDASIQGWGAVCQGVRTGGRWTAEESQSHINMLELKAAFLAIQSFLKEQEAVNVLVRLDNRTAIAYLNRMGSSSLTPLCRLAIQVWDWCLARQIVLRAEYLPGIENTTADWESRHHQDSSDWQLCSSVFDTLSHMLGPFSIDLFASRMNHQLPSYCSWRPDPGACTIDAFSVSWDEMTPYLFPPILPGRQSSVEDTPGLGRICLPDSTGMASTTLVPTGTVNADRLTNFAFGGPRPITQYELPTQPSASGREVVPDCLAYLRQIYEAQGFSQRVAELVIESWRGNTNAAYNSAWRKWNSWCCRRGINPISPTVASIMEFLTDQFDLGLQYRTINTMRSSISTTHPGIEGTAVGSHPLVSRLMRGMFNCRPPIPRYDRSWSIGTVIDFFTNHYKSASLTVLQLAKKAATLLAITNADRCSDLAALDRDHLKQTPTGVEFSRAAH